VVRPRCKHVLVILQNRLEIVDLLREETFPPLPSDFPDDGSLEYAVVNYHNLVVHVPLDCVVFLVGGIPALELTSQLVASAGAAIKAFRESLDPKQRKTRDADQGASSSRKGRRRRQRGEKAKGQAGSPEDDVLTSAKRRNELAGA
jgi:hypothetical protein